MENLNLEKKDEYGLDAVTYSRHRFIENGPSKNRYVRWFYRNFFNIPFKLKVYSYKDAMKYFLKNKITPLNEYPSIVPNWDTTARLKNKAVVLHGSTPELFANHVVDVLNSIKHKPEDDQIVFLKSWNEWAEGNYIEPDIENGRKYLEVLRDALTKQSK